MAVNEQLENEPLEFGQGGEETRNPNPNETSAHYLPPDEDAEKEGALERSRENS